MRRGDPRPPRARDNERTRPLGRIDHQVAPEDKFYEPGRPSGQNARYGEDTRLYRHTYVTSS